MQDRNSAHARRTHVHTHTHTHTQRDLKSSNVVEICTALTAMARVMNAEMIPAVLPLVEKLVSHNREIVRKKAVR
jgi:vesicle coat complex subunit